MPRPERSRSTWMGWLPAAFLLLIIGVVAVVSTVLSSRSSTQSREPGPGEIAASGVSTFTEPGLGFIGRVRQVRLDLSDPPVDAASIGLPETGIVRVGPTDTGLDYRLSVYGGGEEPGGVQLVVADFSVTTADGVVTSVLATPRAQPAFSTVVSELDADAELYGWDFSSRETVVSEMGDATRAGEPYAFEVGPGTRLGFAITALARCEGAGCSVGFELTPTVR